MPNDNKYDRHVWTYRVLGSDESEVEVSHYCTAAELRERIEEEYDIPGTYGVDYLDFTDNGTDGGFVRRQGLG